MGSNTLVIVPTYNERENLPKIVERLMALPVAVEMLVVVSDESYVTAMINALAG